MAIYCRSSIQNINKWRFWIIKNKCIINLINNQPDIDKIYLYAKDPYEAKYQLLIKKCEDVGIKHLNDLKAFVEFSNTMDDVYNNINNCNPTTKRKILIVFDNMISDINLNQTFQVIFKYSFI